MDTRVEGDLGAGVRVQPVARGAEGADVGLGHGGPRARAAGRGPTSTRMSSMRAYQACIRVPHDIQQYMHGRGMQAGRSWGSRPDRMTVTAVQSLHTLAPSPRSLVCPRSRCLFSVFHALSCTMLLLLPAPRDLCRPAAAPPRPSARPQTHRASCLPACRGSQCSGATGDNRAHHPPAPPPAAILRIASFHRLVPSHKEVAPVLPSRSAPGPRTAPAPRTDPLTLSAAAASPPPRRRPRSPLAALHRPLAVLRIPPRRPPLSTNPCPAEPPSHPHSPPHHATTRPCGAHPVLGPHTACAPVSQGALLGRCAARVQLLGAVPARLLHHHRPPPPRPGRRL